MKRKKKRSSVLRAVLFFVSVSVSVSVRVRVRVRVRVVCFSMFLRIKDLMSKLCVVRICNADVQIRNYSCLFGVPPEAL